MQRRARPRRQGGHDPLARPGDEREFETPVTGQMQAAMEAGLGDALVRARRRLRNGGQGSDRFGQLSSRITRALGAERGRLQLRTVPRRERPKNLEVQGNGLTIEEWLTYASPESLSLFMFQKPSAAKRLYFDVIPRTVDDYLGFLDAYPGHRGRSGSATRPGTSIPAKPPAPETSIPARAADVGLVRHAAQSGGRRHTDDPTCSGASCAATRRTPRPRTTAPRRPRPLRGRLLRDFVAPKKRYRLADAVERAALSACRRSFRRCRPARAPRPSSTPSTTSRGPSPLPGREGQGRDARAPGVSNDFFNMVYGVCSRGARASARVVHRALWLAETRALIDRRWRGVVEAGDGR